MRASARRNRGVLERAGRYGARPAGAARRQPRGGAGLVMGGLLAAGLLLTGGCGETPGSPALPGGALRVGALLGDTSAEGFERALARREFVFPADHGPHPGFRSEWWYLTLTLEDEHSAVIGLQFTLFRQALAPEPTPPVNPWLTQQVYLAHLAISDVASGTHRFEERFARGHPELAGARAEPFRLWLEDWQIAGQDGDWRLTAAAADFSVDVTLDLRRPVRLQGEDGLSRKGAQEASYYYSVPGIGARGRIRFDGREREVQGLGWLDREWSTSVLDESHAGWDWLALQLDDGRQIMAFRLRRRDGARDPFDQGLLVEADGQQRQLRAADFTLSPARRWTDAAGARWPVGWTLNLGDRETLHVEALLDDQKLSTLVSYWEGIVGVSDATGRPLGRGYLELTGYDEAREEAGPARAGAVPDADE